MTATDTTTNTAAAAAGRTTGRRGIRRRLGTLAVCVASVAGIIGLPEPASAAAPTQPVMVAAEAYGTHARVFWAPPTFPADQDVVEYQIQRWVDGGQSAQKTWSRPDTLALVDDTVQAGNNYKYRVRARNNDGWGPWGPFNYSGTVYAIQGELWEFGNDAGDFVDRQFQDFLDRAPTQAERSTWVALISQGTVKPAALIDNLMANGTRVDRRHPIIRLYDAYFHRAPDHGGLDYWVTKRANGTKLDVVSASFAGSSEFKNTYGALNNSQFVDLVYENLFDRAPDPAGKAYWTAKLNGGTSRGRMMTQFSESNEYRAISRGNVLAADIYDEMLNAQSKGSELDKWSAHLQGGGMPGGYGIVITGRNAY